MLYFTHKATLIPYIELWSAVKSLSAQIPAVLYRLKL